MDMIYFILGLQGAFVIISTFLLSYVKRKANNYADRQDLQDLTDIVESVKTDYAATLTKIKSQFDLMVGNKKQYREREIEAIIEYFSFSHYYINDFLNLDMSWFDKKNVVELEQMQSEFFGNMKKNAIAKGKFSLFISDENLRIKGHELHMNCLGYSTKLQSLLLRIVFCLRNQIELYEKGTKYILSQKSDLEIEQSIVKEEKRLKDELESFRIEYLNLRKDENDKVVSKSIAEFESAARIYLSSI